MPEEIEILTGSVDEAFLIGDRTARVESKVLTEKGKWKQMLEEEEERDSKVQGRDLCLPKRGNFFFRNAIHGVTDMKVGGKRWVENSAPGLVIPD